MKLPVKRIPLVLAFDHGTSGIKAALADARGAILDFAFVATTTVFSADGGAEQDCEEWWRAAVAAAAQLRERHPQEWSAVRAVAVSSTFSTTVALDAAGTPVRPALSWMDSRGAAAIARRVGGRPSLMGYGLRRATTWLRRSGGAPSLSGKDDAAHVAWLADQWPQDYARTAVFLPSKDYLNFRLTGVRAASLDSIQLFWVTDTRDPWNVRYDDELVRLLGIDRGKLPPLRGSTEILGPLTPAAAVELVLGRQVQVVCGSPDHQCALLGSGAVRPYEAHLYIGTSSWLEFLMPRRKLDALHSIAAFPTFVPGLYQCINEQDLAGGALEFLRQLLGRVLAISGAGGEVAYERLEEIAASADPGSGGVLFAPWLNGERTPVDDHHARGAFLHLAAATRIEDMVRAVLEGVAYNTRWSFEYVERFAGRRLEPIRLIGGGAQSDLWCQIFADVLEREIHRVVDPRHANARGAALLAGLGLGAVELNQIPDLIPSDRVFRPDSGVAELHRRRYRQLVRYYRSNRRVFRTIG